MNHVYRIVWNRVRGAFMVVAESARSHGRGRRASAALSPVRGVVSSSVFGAALTLLAASVHAASLPTGGSIASGTGSISQNGSTLTVQQGSSKLIANWQSFDIASGHAVNFLQPSSSAVALNRVLGNDASQIYGSLNANGQVFLVNPSGVLFGAGASVNVGGLVASTLNISDSDFLAGNHVFTGKGKNATNATVINKGSITADGGAVALLGGTVSNQGVIQANLGSVALAAGNKVTLDFAGDGLLSVVVDESALNALAENKQLIKADGGSVLLTAKATGALLQTVVNNTGVIEAQTLVEREGKIILLGGFDGGSVQVAGKLDASAPVSGDGGFIETSGAHVNIADSATITTKSDTGQSGTWLIDPNDFTIAATGGNMTGAAVSNALNNNGNFVIQTATMGTAGGNGDIFVKDAVSWSQNTLTLNAERNINILAVMTASNSAGLVLNYGGTDGNSAATPATDSTISMGISANGFAGRVDFTGNSNTLNINGDAYTIITSLGALGSTTGTDLQGINGNMAGHYALGANIDASATQAWYGPNGQQGFVPLGWVFHNGQGGGPVTFTGHFEGLGHTIDNLFMYRPQGSDYKLAGLFAWVDQGASIRHLGLNNAILHGPGGMGLLAALNNGLISQVYASGGTISSSGGGEVGGLVAVNGGTIEDSHSTAAVNVLDTGAGMYVGGLAARNLGGTILRSWVMLPYLQSDAEGVGGLVGNSDYGAVISQSWALFSEVSGAHSVGGLVGINYNSTISQSWAEGMVAALSAAGGLVGTMDGGSISQSYANVGLAVDNPSTNGALVGNGAGSNVTDSFYATTNALGSALNPGMSDNGYGTGKTLAELQQLSTFAGWGADIDAQGGTGSVWRIYDGYTTPMLRSFLTSYVLQPDYDGSGTTLANVASVGAGNAQILGSASGTTLTLTGLAGGGGYTATSNANLSGLYSTPTGYDLIIPAGGATRIISTPGSAAGEVLLANGANWTNGTLAIDTTGNASADGALHGKNLDVVNAADVTLANAGNDFTGTVNINASGAVSLRDTNALTLGAVTAGNFTLNAGGTISATGAVNVSRFLLNGGNWVQNTASLPGFNATDFRLQGGTFLRVLGGDGSNGTPWQIADVYGLQGISGFLNKSFTLVGDIDASGTSGWNAGAGFASIGNSSVNFTGLFDGQGHVISGLFINRPAQNNVGLFGLASNATLRNVILDNVNITGNGYVGGLVGSVALGGNSQPALIENVGVTGRVTGNGHYVGGLLGQIYTDAGNVTLRNAWADVVVAGKQRTGGLLGESWGSNILISNAYATGSVAGTRYVGGLVGYNDVGTIANTYSTGAVSGTSDLGGLAGHSDKTITGSYWATDSSGQATSAGGTGKTTAQLKQLSTFAGWNLSGTGGDSTVWRIYDGYTTPLLRSFLTAYTPDAEPDFDGSGAALANIASATSSNPKILGTATGTTLTLTGLAAGGGYTATSDANLSTLYSTQRGYDLILPGGSVTRTISTPGSAAGEVRLASGANWSHGELVVNTSGNINIGGAISGDVLRLNGGGSITDTAALDVNRFVLNGGNWQQLTGSLPAFAAGDFTLNGGSFLRATGGTGTSTPWLLTDVYGLQGMATFLTKSFALANDINASATANWNGGAGFVPVGNGGASFGGIFDGQGHVISNLVIQGDTASPYVGLFGYVRPFTTMGTTGIVRNVGLVGGSVSGNADGGRVGGLVGRAFQATISNVSSTATVASVGNGADVGGLVGLAEGSVISNAGAGGAVSGNRSSNNGDEAGNLVGGLVGMSSSTTISNAYATGAVSGTNSTAGGLVGMSIGSVTNAYATGSVTADGNAGGLVGTAQGSLTNTYAAGLVSGNSAVGGLAGANTTADITNSYWNKNTTGQTRSYVSGTTQTTSGGLTTAQMQTLGSFTGWDISATGGANTVWRIYEGSAAPLLRSFLTPYQVKPVFDGSGAAQANIGSVNTGDLAGAAGHVFGTLTQGNTLTLTSPSAGAYTATANASGIWSDQAGYDFIFSRSINTPGSVAGALALTNPVSWTNGTLAINVSGAITPVAITGGAGSTFLLQNGQWAQSAASLPAFTVNDFRLNGGSFLRALGGDGTSGSPYQLTDLYGLQGVATLLGQNFVLANDINASATANWSAGAGFSPIGSQTLNGPNTPFTGVFDGQGHVISNLRINRNNMDTVGLFGYVGGGTVRNVGLDNASVTRPVGGSLGSGAVGSLVGLNAGSVSNAWATGTVTGSGSVGGLVGANPAGGSVSNSWTSATVTGDVNSVYVGGLLGFINYGSVTNSYATGAVSGKNNVGGLVGFSGSNGVVTNSYATGAVSGTGALGGLLGSQYGATNNSFYATTNASGSAINVGLSGNGNGTGKTLPELKQLSTFASWGADIDAQAGTGSVWRIYEGNTTPLLRNFLTPLSLLPDYDGTGALLQRVAGVAYSSSNPQILGSTTTGGTTLTLTGLAEGGGYTATSDADLSGLYSTQRGYDLSASNTRTISTPGSAAGDVVLPSSLSWSNGNLVINGSGTVYTAGGNLTINGGGGTINVNTGVNLSGTFNLLGGNWVQNTNGGTLPAFFAWDFRVGGGTFLRVLGGDGTIAAPWQLSDVYGLQGMGKLLNMSFVLANDIDATATLNWYNGAGFMPVGNSSTNFSGIFDGQGHRINGLFINRGNSERVGLFGSTQGATIHNVGLMDVSVKGVGYVGGLVGRASGGTITNAWVTGSVTGGEYSYDVGGLVGELSNGSLTNAWSTVSVTAIDGGSVGGLVGYLRNSSSLTNSWASGDVVTGGYSSVAVGGLVGYVSGGTITNSYATGSVTGGSQVGGLVGYRIGSVINSYYATTNASGNAINTGFSGNGTGKTYAQLQQLSTFADWGADIDAQGGTGSVWRIYEGSTTPLLRNFLMPLVLQPDYDSSGSALANIASVTVPTDPRILGSFTQGDTLTLTSTAAGSYTATSNANLSGLYSTQQGYDISYSNSRSISTPGSAAGEVRLDNAVDWSSGTLVVSASRIDLNAVLTARDTAGLALSYSDVLDLGLTDSGFAGRVDFTGEANSLSINGDVYTLVSDVAALQSLGGSGHYALSADIDASGIANFSPVSNFSGVFEGLGHVVDGVTINRSTTDRVGLFGTLATGGIIRNVGLTNASITGRKWVGGVVGLNEGKLSSVSASGVVTGTNNNVGGLAGSNLLGAVIEDSLSEATVSGVDEVGGLVGRNTGSIADSMARGTVNGRDYVGGLVGRDNAGTVTASFWDMAATGRVTSAGGVGLDTVSLQDLATYLGAGWSIADSADAGATTTWVIDDGEGYPQLRMLLP